MKRLFCLLLALNFLIPSEIASGEPQLKEFTLFVYMTGSDLESRDGFATAEMEEMRLSDFDDNILNLVIMAGGAERWSNAQSAETTAVYTMKRIRGELRSVRVESYTDMNMGEADTLSFFLEYGVEQYPAQEYALILWDHGKGPMEGICFDETHDQDGLSLEELGDALSASQFRRAPLSWIGFDACLMASIETANICAPYAKYMIASQETEPAYGWDYSFLKSLRPGLGGDEAGRLIVESYANPEESHLMQTLSCVNLSEMGKVNESSASFFSALGGQLTMKSFSHFSGERQSVKSFGRATTLSNYDLVDMYHLAEQFADEAPLQAGRLQDSLRQAIVCNAGNQENANGLSIYSPYYNKNQYIGKWQQEYARLTPSSSYIDYMARYAELWLGKALADWGVLSYCVLPSEKDGHLKVEVTLSEDQLANFASAQMVILQETGLQDTWRQVYLTPEVSPDGNILCFDYDFTALYAVDENGTLLTDALSFELVDGYYLVTSAVENLSRLDFNIRNALGEKVDWQRFRTALRGHFDPGKAYMTIDGLYTLTDAEYEESDTMQVGREISNLRSIYNYMDFSTAAVSRVMSFNEDGTLQPFTVWPRRLVNLPAESVDKNGTIIDTDTVISLFANCLSEGLHLFGEAPLFTPWHLKLLPLAEKERINISAQFILTDTQGNQHGSSLIPLDEDRTLTSDIYEPIYRDEEHHVEAAITRIQAVQFPDHAEVRISVSCKKPSQDDFLFTLHSFSLNGEPVTGEIRTDSFSAFENGITEEVTVYILDLPALTDPVLKEIQFERSSGYHQSLGITEHVDYENNTAEVMMDLTSFVSVQGSRETRPGAGPLLKRKLTDYNIVISLLPFVREDDGRIRGALSFKNLNDEEVTLELMRDGICVNDCYLENAFIGPRIGQRVFTLSPYEEKQLDFILSLPQEEGAPSFQAWRISQVEKLTLYMKITLGDLSDEGEVPLELPEPFTVPEAEDSRWAESPSLFMGPGISVGLEGVELEEGRLILYLDLGHNRDSSTTLTFENAFVDGQPAQLRAYAEFSHQMMTPKGEKTGFELAPNSLREKCSLVLFPQEGNSFTSNFTEVSLGILYSTPDNSPLYFRNARFSKQENDSARAGFFGRFLSAFVDKQQAEEKKTRWLPDELKVDAVGLPVPVTMSVQENTEDFEVSLAVEPPEEVLSALSKGDAEVKVYLIGKPELGRETVPVYAFLEQQARIENQVVSVPFSGLLPFPKGGDWPIPYVDIDDGYGISGRILRSSIEGWCLEDYQGTHSVDYSDATVGFSDGAVSELNISSIHIDETPAEACIRYPAAAAPVRWEADGRRLWVDTTKNSLTWTSVPYEDNTPVFSFLPADRVEELYVLFAFTLRDGGVYQTILPYAAAGSPVSGWSCLVCGAEALGSRCPACGEVKGSWRCAVCGEVNNADLCTNCNTDRIESITRTAMESIEAQAYESAVPFLEEMLPFGSLYAAEWLTYIYREGLTSDKNEAFALEYARKGMELGSGYCARILGDIQMEAADYREAVHCYETAAALGQEDVYRKIGDLYRDPRYGIQDDEAAHRAYLEGADRGDRYAAEWVAHDYYSGTGTARDLEKALVHFRALAAEGSGYASLMIGNILLEEQLYTEALEAYRQAAERDETRAWSWIGMLCRDEQYGIHDYEAAKEAYRQAVHFHNETQDMYWLGVLLRDSAYGEPNLAQAEEYLRAVYEAEDDLQYFALYQLGLLYLDRRDGDGFSNFSTALTYLRIAANAGVEAAYEALCTLRIPSNAAETSLDLPLELKVSLPDDPARYARSFYFEWPGGILEEGLSVEDFYRLYDVTVQIIGLEEDGYLYAYRNALIRTYGFYERSGGGGGFIRDIGLVPVFEGDNHPLACFMEPYEAADGSFTRFRFSSDQGIVLAASPKEGTLVSSATLLETWQIWGDAEHGEGQIFDYSGGEMPYSYFKESFMAAVSPLAVAEYTGDLVYTLPLEEEHTGAFHDFVTDRFAFSLVPVENLENMFLGITLQKEDGSGFLVLIPYEEAVRNSR